MGSAPIVTCFIISGDDHLDDHFRPCRSACAGRREDARPRLRPHA